MKKIEYSQIVRRKLKELRIDLQKKYGNEKASSILSSITSTINNLQQFEKCGINISSIYDIQTDYWYIYTNHNYFIYRIETKKIIIVQMFHEHEDFMLTLFNVSSRTQESIDYWGE